MSLIIPRSLMKTCGIAAVVAGLLLAFGFILHPANEAATNGTNPRWVPAHSLLWASFTIASWHGWAFTRSRQASVVSSASPGS